MQAYTTSKSKSRGHWAQATSRTYVHNYSEKGRNFVGDRKIPFLLKLNQLAQCYDERFKLYLENVWWNLPELQEKMPVSF